MTDPAKPLTVEFEETGEEREIKSWCFNCFINVHKGDPRIAHPMIVSPSGIVHEGDNGRTNCGHDATGERWWHRL